MGRFTQRRSMSGGASIEEEIGARERRTRDSRPRDRARAGERRGKRNEETKGARPKSASETTDDANELFRVDLFARAQPR